MNVIENILRVLAQYHAFRATLNGLGKLTDRQLSELGIERSEVVRHAYENAESAVAERSRADAAAATWPPTAAISAR